MMSKVKKALITATIFIVVGISGSIVSGFYVVPQFAAEAYRVQREVRNAVPKEKEVFVTSEAVETLDISALQGNGFDVEIKPSSDNNTRVKTYEYYENSITVDTSYDGEGKRLIVSGQRSIYNLLDAENLKGFFEEGYKTIIGNLVEEANRTSQIVIEVPTGVNVNFKGTDGTNLIVKDSSVLKDNLNFSCYYGYVDLPFNNNLKNIDIKTNAYFEMDLREFINADKVNIEASNISIVSRGYSNEYSNITKLPESVTIFGRNNVDVESFLPLGKNVVISSDHVEYDSNFEAYPVNLQLRGRERANSYYSDRMKGDWDRYIDSENFQGVLGSGEAAEYNLSINRYYSCDIENLSNLDIEADLREY
ncbi:MAG: hypothetical protein E6344_00970 [Clostridium sp.]|nr:hypothetical protein [Clostridium sp.]MDU7082232.1 hypothetical protein [Clostridium sp.]